MNQSLNTSQVAPIGWAVDELRQELNKALRILEDHAEESGDGASLEGCVDHLKQVTGIFAVTNLTLPQMLCEDLQSSILDCSRQTGTATTDRISIIAEAILELNHYLGNLNRSDRLIPQVNNLRALTGRELFTESPAFEINLSRGLEAFNKGSSEHLDSQTIRKLRTLCQRSVLNLIRGGFSNEAVAGLQRVFKVLYRMGGTAYLSAMGHGGLALLERLHSGNLKLNIAVKTQFKRLDEALCKLIAGTDYEDTGLLKNILYYVAIGSNHSDSTARLIRIFSLESYGSASSEGSHTAIEPALIAGVVEVLQTEIEQAKTWLDDCLYQVCEFGEAVTQVDAILRRVDDTLVMINAAQLRVTTRQLQEILERWKSLDSEEDISSDEFDKFANAMIELEYGLQNLTDRQSGNDSDEPADIGSARTRILSETRAILARIKTSMAQFIEENWQWSILEEISSSLAVVEGALRFYPLEDLARVAGCIRRYVRESLLEKREEPDRATIELFTDVVAAIDYYLECLEHDTVFNLDALISRAMDNCVQLGFPHREESESKTAGDEDREDTKAAGREHIDDGEEDFDNLAIFVEEAEEILPLALQQLEAWKTEGEQTALLDLRRGFHTLKGGGRMIGATVLSELSGSIENMLNRIIENSIDTTDEVHDLVGKALERYPDLLGELARIGLAAPANDEILAIQERAAALADPLTAGSEFESEHSELTSTFVSKAETLRQVIIAITGAETSGSSDLGASQQLVKTIRTLSDSARTAEFEDLADSFTPLQKLLQRYAAKASLSNELVVLLSIWADKFDKTLASLKSQGSFEISSLAEIAQQAEELLQREKALADSPASRERKRLLPLRQLMAEGLDKLIVAEQLLLDWKMGQLPAGDLDQLHGDLQALQSAAENSGVNEIAELCVLIAGVQTALLGEETLSDTAGNWLQEAFGLLLEMLDAVASQQSIPKISDQLANSRPQAGHPADEEHEIPAGISATEAQTGDDPAEPLETEPEMPVSRDLSLDADEEHEIPAGISATEAQTGDDPAEPLETEPEMPVSRDLSLDADEEHEIPAGISATEAQTGDDPAEPLETDPEMPVSRDLSLDADEEHEIPAGISATEAQTGDDPAEPLETEPEMPVSRDLSLDADEEHEIPAAISATEAQTGDDPAEPLETEPEMPVSRDLSLDTTPLDSEDEFQRELLDTFLEEADDLLQEINTAINSWKREPSAFGNADLIHRALHTLKGGARLSGLAKLGNQSHDFESFIIDQQILKKADGAFFTRALEWLDLMNAHIEAIREACLTGSSIAEVSVPETISEVGSSPATVEDSKADEPGQGSGLYAISAGEPAPSEPPVDDSPGKLFEAVETQPAKAEPGAVPEVMEQRRDRQEHIRLRADTVQEMVKLSGESTVHRGRVAAQLTGLNAQFDELGATIDRIQQLARRLNTETEAQIQFRSEQLAETGDESDFDPLEMDRYSTLQQLSRQLIESASDLQDVRGTLSDSNRDASILLEQSGRIQTELNGHLMRTRMVSFERILPRLERIVRQVSREVGKKAEIRALDISGEIDRQILESLLPPIEHILRNAIDHGIEDSEGRKNAGKPPSGRITVNLHRDSSYMVLTLTDDGAGIDFEAVRKQAVDQGLIDEVRVRALSQEELAAFLFTTGFSTTGSVTHISGRGVGMDVVRAVIGEMGGSVTVHSEKGRGSEFRLSIPFTLSVNRALMVHVGDDTYALPLASLEALVRLSRTDLETYYDDPDKKLVYGADEYEFGYLGETLKTLDRPPLDAIVESTVSVVLFRVGTHRIALLIDEIIGSHEVVVKALSQPFSAVPGLSGAAVMGDGSVVVALDMPTLVSGYFESRAQLHVPVKMAETFAEERTPTIMVVDDSVTVRKVTSRFLTREGFAVETARDGVDALRLAHDQQPDLMLVDVEMPRMGGFELLGVLKSIKKFKDIPVVLITSRTGKKHEQRGLSLGADSYFGKPYREDELRAEINRLLSGDKK